MRDVTGLTYSPLTNVRPARGRVVGQWMAVVVVVVVAVVGGEHLVHTARVCRSMPLQRWSLDTRDTRVNYFLCAVKPKPPLTTNA